ncbi:MAG: ribonuclease HII [Pyrinomonadaceae bacterium]|nr:ribonuclease HII [Pyrinomonadaceae bacterium]
MKDEEAALQTKVAHDDAAAREESAADGSSPSSHPSPARRRRVSLVGTSFEDEARSRGYKLIAGVDEVGRGALAGPVVAAAVILNPEAPLPAGLDDSKKLTAKARERIAEELRQTAVAYSVGLVGPDEIDRINILEATRRAMLYALRKLEPCADFVLIDALQLKECELPQRAIIRGDSVSASIAAASVIAKTYRDHLMHELHDLYPYYNFSKHVGYGTREHLSALRAHGCCPIHRRSFRGVVTEESRAEG